MNNLALLIPDIKVDNPKPDPDLWNTTDINWENAFRVWNEINLITDIDYQRLDLFDDEEVSLTQTIQDVRDIEKIFTDFSRSFSLPASAKNNLLFRHYYRTDIVENLVSDSIFNANTKLRAIIELNYKRFKSGYIVLNGVKLKNNQPDSYNITFFGETVTLKDKLKDRILSSLDFSEFDHTYNVANVKEGLESFVTQLGNQTVSDAKIIYPLISHTQRFIFDNSNSDGGVLSTQNRSSLTRNLFFANNQSDTGSGATERKGSTKGFVFNDLKPAIRVIDVLRTIEQDPDIDLEFSDDFFTDTGMFADLYMWLHRNKGIIGVQPNNESDISNIIINNISNFTGDITTFFNPSPFGSFPQFDGGIFRFRTGQQGSETVTETMQITFIVTPDTSSKKFTLKLKKAGTGEVIKEVKYTQIGSASLTQNFVTNVAESFEKHNVQFVIETPETSLTLSSISLSFQRVIVGTPNAGTTNISAGLIEPKTLVSTIFVSENVPDISILSFLTGLFKMFNLTAFVEDDPSNADFGNVVVKTLDDFYGSGTSRDITDFVDTSEGESNFSVPFNDVEFKFSDPSTFGSFFFEKINNRQLGSVKATDATNSGRDPRLNRGQDYRIELPFEKMFFEKLTNTPDNADTTIGYGYFVDDNQDPIVKNPLLFFKTSTSASIQMQDGGGVGTPANITTYNRPSNFRVGTQNVQISLDASESSAVSFSYVEPNTFVTSTISVAPGALTTFTMVTGSLLRTSSVSDESNITTTLSTQTTGQTINFGNEVDAFVPTINPDTLFESFYKKYIRDVFSYNRRLVKVNAILPQKFLLRYKLSDTIILNNTEYYINKITTNLQTGKSTLELLTKINTIS